MELPESLLLDPLALALATWLGLNVVILVVACVAALVRRHEPLR
ncbi:hypothetical protein [Deinococcus pimensis]|nr:hypothetical protein [Deinococcus pimensis]